MKSFPILHEMQTTEPPASARRSFAELQRAAGLWAVGEAMTWSAGLVLAVSAFTNWYSGHSADGLTLAVTGWNTGTLGKLVFVLGIAVVALVFLREVLGVEPPRALPEPLLVVALGTVATIF